MALAALMVLAYLLSCLGASGPGPLNPVCYDGERARVHASFASFCK